MSDDDDLFALPPAVVNAMDTAVEYADYLDQKWVVDQMIQDLLGYDYKHFLQWYNENHDTPWEHGVTPPDLEE